MNRLSYIGLRQTWDKGYRILSVEVDSLTIYNWITKDDLGWKHVNLIHECRDLLKKPWSVDIHHVYRESNRIVDFLAKNALMNTYKNIIKWQLPPKALDDIFETDCDT